MADSKQTCVVQADNFAMDKKKLHECGLLVPQNWGYGSVAVDYCCEDEEGHLSVTNGEYGNYVNFCPFCGFKAKVQVPIPSDRDIERERANRRK